MKDRVVGSHTVLPSWCCASV